MASLVPQQNNLLKDARQSINAAANLAQLKSACLDLVDAIRELKRDNRRLENVVRKLQKRIRQGDI